MSNPFAAFRKNQKKWMAALVLLAIFAFVIAPALQYAQNAISGGGSSSNVVVRWNGGKITLADLQNSTRKHSNLVRFLSELAEEVVEAGGQPNVPGFFYDPQSRQVLGIGIDASDSAVDVCNMRIRAMYGKQIGIELSDEAIDDFIREYCNGKVSTDRLKELLSNSSGGNLLWYEARELLKQELTAVLLLQTARTGIATHSPGKTYRDFQKLNRTAKVEAFPVFVVDHLEEVTSSPSEAEIQSIYDAGSVMAPNPNTPEPGFFRLSKANVQYVEANLQDWVDREKAKLTDEQLRTEYDRRVELGQLKIPVTAESPSVDPPADNENEGSEEAPAPTEDPATEDPATEEPATEEPSQDAATQDAPEEPDNSNEPAPEDQSSHTGGSTRFVTYVQEEDEPSEAETQEGDPAGPPPVTQPPQLGNGVQDNPAGASGNAPNKPDDMRTQTFAEAKDSIADSLARDVAIPALDKALTGLLDEVMNPYYGAHRQYTAFMESGLTEEDGEKRQPPTKPDLKKEAEQRGLTVVETGMVDGSQIAQTEFGLGNLRQGEWGRNASVANVVTRADLELYRPIQSSYFDRAALQNGELPEFLQFLFWKIDSRPAYIPELSEARAEVVDAWKQRMARQLAENAARAKAKTVDGGADEPWKEALSTAETALIAESEPFTWMMRFGENTMTSIVPKLDSVGSEFMQRVFSTPAGQVSTAPNRSQSIYYVFRVVAFSPSEEDLQQRFAADPIKSGPLGIARQENDSLVRAWYEDLNEKLDVQWEMNVNQFN